MVTVMSTYIIGFLWNLVCKLGKSPYNGASNICFKLYKKLINRVYGSLSKYDQCSMPNCSLCNGAYLIIETGQKKEVQPILICWWEYNWSAWWVSAKDNKEVFHIQMVISAVDVVNFIESSLMIALWETSDMNETPQNKKVIFASTIWILLLKQCGIVATFFSIKRIITYKIPFQHNNSETKPMVGMKNESMCFDETKKAE